MVSNQVPRGLTKDLITINIRPLLVTLYADDTIFHHRLYDKPGLLDYGLFLTNFIPLKLVLNSKKTKCIYFTRARSFDVHTPIQWKYNLIADCPTQLSLKNQYIQSIVLLHLYWIMEIHHAHAATTTIKPMGSIYHSAVHYSAGSYCTQHCE